jgi:hypothetical protein
MHRGGHKKLRTKNRTERTRNRTKTKKISSKFGSQFQETKLCSVISILTLGSPKKPNTTKVAH